MRASIAGKPSGSLSLLPVCKSQVRLQVATASNRVLPLAAFRGSNRPVLLVGNRGYLQKAEAAAAPYRDALRERAVSSKAHLPLSVLCVVRCS